MSAQISCNPLDATCKTFDLIVVGGGIYGALLTLEATRCGLRPLLIERDQFGQATSNNTLRIIHGGLRYLQNFDLRRFKESLREQAWFFRNFPEHVTPLGCLMPLYNRGLRRKSIFRIALALNDYLARYQDGGMRGRSQLPKSTILSREETIRLFPDVDTNGLRGGACWCDMMMPDPQRLLKELLSRACQDGAICLTYMEATKLLVEEQQVSGLEAIEQKTGNYLQFRAPIVVNCAGPWCRDLAGKFDRDIPKLFHGSIAFNLLLNRPSLSSSGIAVTPKRPHASTYFLLPLENQILAGTFHQAWKHPLTNPRPTHGHIQEFVHDLNLAVPKLQLTRDDVLEVHAGFLPAKAVGSRHPATKAVVYDHGAMGGPLGLYSISGVKFTTARAVAETTLRKMDAWRPTHSHTSHSP